MSNKTDLELLEAILRMSDDKFNEYDRRAHFRGMKYALTNATIRKLSDRQRAHAEEGYAKNGLNGVPASPETPSKKTKGAVSGEAPALSRFAFEVQALPKKPPARK